MTKPCVSFCASEVPKSRNVKFVTATAKATNLFKYPDQEINYRIVKKASRKVKPAAHQPFISTKFGHLLIILQNSDNFGKNRS